MYWLISANPKYYNHFEAFNDNGYAYWHQPDKNFKIGDKVFIYTSKPFQLITFETMVEEINVPAALIPDDSKYWLDDSKRKSYKTYMKLKLVNSFTNESLLYDNLHKNGLKRAPQGKIKLSGELLNYILEISKNHEFLEDDVIYNDDKVVENIITTQQINDIEISLTPPKPKQGSAGLIWPRNPMNKAIALKRAEYSCEVEKSHPTFLRKVSNVRYTEGHHLIPLSAQGEERFKNVNLDCPQNIVSLCSNCHNQIHYGKDVKEIITKLYYLRKEQLSLRGIEIELEDLLKYYE